MGLIAEGLWGRNILSLFEMMRSTLPLKRKTISLDLVANGKRGRGNCLSAQKSGKEELGSCIHVRRAVKKSTWICGINNKSHKNLSFY